VSAPVAHRILVVDDEVAISDAVSYTLRGEGFDIDVRDDGESALEAARATAYDLVILDLMLPSLSGMEVCRRLRSEGDVPILLLSARDAEVDRVLGLEGGADDYVTKPFSMAELVSRVRAILRRRDLDRRGAAAVRRVGGLTIDLERHEVAIDGTPTHLTPSEFRLLALLSSEPGRAFSRAELVRELWDSSFTADERACDSHVANLRRKVEPDASQPQRIVSVRGVGYRLDAV
jgi:two-component system, OmpR family, response regulator RegX3